MSMKAKQRAAFDKFRLAQANADSVQRLSPSILKINDSLKKPTTPRPVIPDSVARARRSVNGAATESHAIARAMAMSRVHGAGEGVTSGNTRTTRSAASSALTEHELEMARVRAQNDARILGEGHDELSFDRSRVQPRIPPTPPTDMRAFIKACKREQDKAAKEMDKNEFLNIFDF